MRILMAVLVAMAIVAACTPGGGAPVEPIDQPAVVVPTREPVTAAPATAPPVEPVTPTAPPVTGPVTDAPITEPPAEVPATVYYKNCTAVRAAGKAPLHPDDPGYRTGLDRDNDGLACE